MKQDARSRGQHSIMFCSVFSSTYQVGNHICLKELNQEVAAVQKVQCDFIHFMTYWKLLIKHMQEVAVYMV